MPAPGTGKHFHSPIMTEGLGHDDCGYPVLVPKWMEDKEFVWMSPRDEVISTRHCLSLAVSVPSVGFRSTRPVITSYV